jgi:hypothetical protein
MYQHRQSSPVHHQEWHECGKLVGIEGGDSVIADLAYDGDAAAEYHERRAIEREHLFRSADHEQMRRRIATLESQVRNLTEVVNTLIDVVVAKDAAP